MSKCQYFPLKSSVLNDGTLTGIQVLVKIKNMAII